MVSVRQKRHNRTVRKTNSKQGKAADRTLISSSMRVMDIVSLCEGSEQVLADFGIFCAGCSIGGVEMLSEACTYHGLGESDLQELVSALNALFVAQPEHPPVLMITSAAARAVRKIAQEEGRIGEALVVTADGQGGFCMEFQKEFGAELLFNNTDVPEVDVRASMLTLRRIGGSTIDYREGRFKLDLPEQQCADCEHETCQCGKAEKKAD